MRSKAKLLEIKIKNSTIRSKLQWSMHVQENGKLFEVGLCWAQSQIFGFIQ